MLSDALAQHLRAQNWTSILLLHGNSDQDAVAANAARRSIAKFGLGLVADRTFELSNDPRHRDRNNIALLTSGPRHDVIWLVDSEGEFGRYVPYATQWPRPVVGSEGLMPLAWHWTWERNGAPQLNQRFRREAGRDMTSEDWAAWVATRAIIEAVTRLGAADPAEVAAFVRSDALAVDLYKGARGSFRQWNGQLRQPVLLATHNAVITTAPVDGFQHQTDTLDTLGLDEQESRCRL
jgi:ABC transporter substrate binding protein (PQQ-dependent alcohol dehydrogenase system)